MYVHDGQNLFDPDLSSSGDAWELDKAMRLLISENRVRPAIVVGIWNTEERMREYLPNKPFYPPHAAEISRDIEHYYGGPPLADSYLRFLTEELKPFIDTHYPTESGRDDTFIMGSSMGALVSLYAFCEYSDTFSGAACMSTHWPAVHAVFRDYLTASLPLPERRRIYFDYGTETLDREYEPFQRQVDEIVAQAGYEHEKNWITRRFEGADHSEFSWRFRAHVPLTFLLGTK
jgi:predicted alpha/beta superfamily hydrolase